MKKIKKGFTLAEVLITLGIIGVVAALTIPGLLNKSNDTETVARLKKGYSTIENARKLTAIDEGGDISSLFTGGHDPLQNFAKHLNVTKYCEVGNADCYSDDAKDLKGTTSSPWWDPGSSLILSDGASMLLSSYDNGCRTVSMTNMNNCGLLFLDINGPKGPKTVGRDIFVFNVTRDGIYPEGGDNYSEAALKTECSSTGFGWTCAWKILSEGGINYDYGR